MNTVFDFSSVTVSWTKYDIVYIPDIVESKEIMESYHSGEVGIDEAILKAFLGIRHIQDPLPSFWNEVFSLDLNNRKSFAFFIMLFSRYQQCTKAMEAMRSPLKGVYDFGEDTPLPKELTNLRSFLVKSGLSSQLYRRSSIVPFDGSTLLNEKEVGPLFKRALENFISIHSSNYDPKEFYEISEVNNFHKVLGFSSHRIFREWLEGKEVHGNYVRSIRFDKFLMFDQPCDLQLDKRKEVYFVGENGDGKTVLLMAIFLAMKGFRAFKDLDPTYIGPMIGVMNRAKNNQLLGYDDLNREYSLTSAPSLPNIFAYGIHRSRYSTATDQPTYERFGFMSLFSQDMTLTDPSDWLWHQAVEKSSKHTEAAFENISKILSSLLEKKLEVLYSSAGIIYREKGVPLSLAELSEGYRSIIIFVCDLLKRLTESTPDGSDVFNQSGIVLIDEICLFLHPRWQRNIVHKLRELFPNIQFIMTTHSPIIVLGASEDAVIYRIARDEGHTYISDPYYRSDMDDMMLNTLVTSSLFGLNSASMNEKKADVDTSDSYLTSRIRNVIEKRLLAEKGRMTLTNEEIDKLIDDTISDELKNDKNQQGLL